MLLKLSSLSYRYELINEGLEPQKQTRSRRVAGRKKKAWLRGPIIA